MGCNGDCSKALPQLTSIDSGMLEEEKCELVVYEVRRISRGVYAVTFETPSPIRIGTVLYFYELLAHVVNASSDRIKIFLYYEDDLQILVNYRYSIKLTQVGFPAPAQPYIVVAHYLAVPLALYLNLYAPAYPYRLLVVCWNDSDVIFREQLQQARANFLCVENTERIEALALLFSQLDCMLKEAASYVFAIGPPWLLRCAGRAAYKHQCEAYGLIHLYGRAPKCDYRWIDLRTESLASYCTENDELCSLTD